jgi:DNA polymerase-3 subunit delta'
MNNIEILVNERTSKLLELCTKNPTQAVILHGPSGSGKKLLAKSLATEIVNLDYANHLNVNFFEVTPLDEKALTIEQIRNLKKSLSLSGVGEQLINRIITIFHIDSAEEEAQNSLLKILEEQPKGTMFILLATDISKLIDTVRSRCIEIPILPVSNDSIYEKYGSSDKIIKFATLSGGRAELLNNLVIGEQEELLSHIDRAKQIFSQPKLDRLLKIDSISKSRTDINNLIEAMELIASSAIRNIKIPNPQFFKWLSILEVIKDTKLALNIGGNPKLHLTKLFTSI